MGHARAAHFFTDTHPGSALAQTKKRQNRKDDDDCADQVDDAVHKLPFDVKLKKSSRTHSCATNAPRVLKPHCTADDQACRYASEHKD